MDRGKPASHLGKIKVERTQQLPFTANEMKEILKKAKEAGPIALRIHPHDEVFRICEFQMSACYERTVFKATTWSAYREDGNACKGSAAGVGREHLRTIGKQINRTSFGMADRNCPR